MMHKIIAATISLLIIYGCNSENKPSNKVSQTSDSTVATGSWRSEKKFFKYAKLNSIDFNTQGDLIQEVQNLKKVDTIFKNKNFEHFLDRSWINVTDIYHYGTILIQGKEQPVYLSIKDHNGLSYNYHLVNFDSKGNIIGAWLIAYSWTAAECIGYDRIFIKADSMISETLQKCFGEELEGKQSIDSIRDIAPLSTFQFDS